MMILTQLRYPSLFLWSSFEFSAGILSQFVEKLAQITRTGGSISRDSSISPQLRLITTVQPPRIEDSKFPFSHTILLHPALALTRSCYHSLHSPTINCSRACRIHPVLVSTGSCYHSQHARCTQPAIYHSKAGQIHLVLALTRSCYHSRRGTLIYPTSEGENQCMLKNVQMYIKP